MLGLFKKWTPSPAPVPPPSPRLTGSELVALLARPDWKTLIEAMPKPKQAEVLLAEEEMPFEKYIAIPDWPSRESYLSSLSGRWSWDHLHDPADPLQVLRLEKAKFRGC